MQTPYTAKTDWSCLYFWFRWVIVIVIVHRNSRIYQILPLWFCFLFFVKNNHIFHYTQVIQHEYSFYICSVTQSVDYSLSWGLRLGWVCVCPSVSTFSICWLWMYPITADQDWTHLMLQLSVETYSSFTLSLSDFLSLWGKSGRLRGSSVLTDLNKPLIRLPHMFRLCIFVKLNDVFIQKCLLLPLIKIVWDETKILIMFSPSLFLSPKCAGFPDFLSRSSCS